MCKAVLEVMYKNRTEPDQLIPFSDDETLYKRIEELMNLETVSSLTVFRPHKTHQRVTSWQTSDH